MAVYTTQLRTICTEIAENKEGYERAARMSPDEIIEAARPVLFDFLYPVYDENYKPVLETKIIKHFFFREIGLETPAQFKFFLNETLNLEMPVLNEYYKTAVLQFNPLYDVDITRERHGEAESDRTGQDSANISQTETSTGTDVLNGSGRTTNQNTSITNGTARLAHSDTPQNGLTDVDNNRYLTDYQKNQNNQATTDSGQGTSESTSNGTSTSNRNASGTNTTDRQENIASTDHYIETVKGKQGMKSYSEMITDFRNALVNVDKMVFEKLEPLFMGIY